MSLCTRRGCKPSCRSVVSQCPCRIWRLASTNNLPSRSWSPARSASIIFPIRIGKAACSRFKPRIARRASSNVIGSAVLAISRAISCFCRTVAYIAWHPMKAQSGGRSCPKESQQIRHVRHTTYFAGATLGTIRHAEVRTSLRAGHAPGNSVALAKSRVLGALDRLAASLLAYPHR